MEHLNIYLIVAFGAVATLMYLYLLLVKKSSLVSNPSKLVVFLLLFVAFVGALIRYSQIYDQNLSFVHYLEIAQYAFMLPSIAIGIALLKIVISFCIGAIGAILEHKL